MSEPCLFCAIADGRIPATVVQQDDEVMAFRDVAPQAPVHVLVIPKAHHPTIAAVVAVDAPLAARMLATAGQVAQQEGVDGSGYRMVINTGDQGGQTVAHAHIHILGRRQLTWPPG